MDDAAKTYTIEVADGAADVTLNSDDVNALGTDVALIKTGKGRLIISTDLKTAGYDGEIVISNGYLRTTLNGALGGTEKGTAIINGGTLEIEDNSTSYSLIHKDEPISMEGAGVDGHGAMYATKNGASIATNGMCGQAPVTLTGDTIVGYSGEEGYDGTFGIRNSKCLDMNGYTLVVQGGSNGGFFGLKNGDTDPGVVRPGHIVIRASCGKFTMENCTRLGGNDANTFTVEAGVTLRLVKQPSFYWNTYQPSAWTLIAPGDFTLYVTGNDDGDGDGGGHGWGGPVQLGGTMTFVGKQLFGRLDGVVSGTGGITVQEGTLKMLGHNNPSKTNTYTGGTQVKSGATLFVESMALVPADKGGFVVEGGAHAVYSDPAKDTTATAERAMAAALSVCTNASFSVETTDFIIDTTVEIPSFTGPLIGPMTFAGCFSPNANFQLASTLSNGVALRQNAGTKTTVTTGGDAGTIYAYNGVIDIGSGAFVDVGSNGVYADGLYPSVGRVSVHGTLVQTLNAAQAIDAGRGEMTITEKSRGIFEMFGDAIVTGRLERARAGVENAKAQGSYFLHGGTLYSDHAGIESFPAHGRCGYHSIETGATWLDHGNTRVGPEGTAIYHVRGGTFKCFKTNDGDSGMNAFHAGVSGGTTDILVDNGGKMIFENTAFSLGRAIEQHESQTLGRKCAMGIDGDGTLVDFDYTQGMWWVTPDLAASCGAITSIGVMNGATIRSSVLNKPTTGYVGGGSSEKIPLTGNRVFVSFDRGTYQAGNNNNRDYLFTGFGADDHVLLLEGGMTIQSDYAYKVGVALEAPIGNGIKSISLPDEIRALGAWEYIAAPRVEISDPTGVGAAAVAVFDTTNGVVTAIKVICPGINYTDPTVTVKYGGYTKDFVFKSGVELAHFPSGGFTKTGSKMLTIDVACTYTGPTTVAEGLLRLGADNVIDTSSGVLMAGGVLDVNGKAFGCELLGGCGEILNAGDTVTAAQALVFNAADLVAKRKLETDSKIVLPEGSTVSVEDVAAFATSDKHSFILMTSELGIEGDLPTLSGDLAGTTWRLFFTADRKSLKLNDGSGFAIIVK